MSSYISSNANRFYTALESTYGNVGSIAAVNRIPAVKLGIKQQIQTGTRKDKTGSRTFAGTPAGVSRHTDFNLQTYLTSWDKATAGAGIWSALSRRRWAPARCDSTRRHDRLERRPRAG